MSRYKYKLWCMIFQDICKSAKVIGHINGKSKPISEDDEDWKSIDSYVNSWFYSPYDPYLLQIISNDNCTTKDIWEMHRSPLSGIFSTTIELFFVDMHRSLSSLEANGFSFCFPSHVGSTASRQSVLHGHGWSSNMSFNHGIMSSLTPCNSMSIMVVNNIIITIT